MTIDDPNTVERRRTARKAHACGFQSWGGCSIVPGDVYLEVVEFPGGESGTATNAGRPVRMAVCARCVGRTDRTRLEALDPIPYEQCCRQGLL